MTNTQVAEQIAAAGIVPALRNADAEKCAQDIAAVIYSAGKRQAIFAAFHRARLDLKAWEAQAIRNRAFCIAKETGVKP